MRPSPSKPDIVIDHEIVPLAGHDHVVVAIQAQLCRASGFLRHQCGNAGKQRRLTLFAAERAAHAPAFHDHVLGLFAQRMSYFVLHFAGMLRRAVNQQVAILSGHGHGDMPLEVKLVLAAQVELSVQAVWRIAQRFLAVPPGDRFAGQDEGLLADSFLRIEYRGQQFVLDVCKTCCPARLRVTVCRNGEYRVAHILHHLRRENRIVFQYRTEIVRSGYIGRGEHRHHAGRRKNRFEIEVLELRVGMFARTYGDVQQAARFRDIVRIQRPAADVQMTAVVGQRLSDSTAGGVSCQRAYS